MSSAPSASSVLEAARLARQTYDELLARRAALQSQASAIQQQILVVRKSPVRLDDLKAFIFKHVDSLASQFTAVARWDKLVEAYALPEGAHREAGPRAPLCLADLDKAPGAVVGLERGLGFFTGAAGTSASDEMRACFFFGDLIKARVGRYLDSMASTTVQHTLRLSGGSTLEEKREEVAANEKKLAAVELEISGVSEQISEIERATGFRPNAVLGTN